MVAGVALNPKVQSSHKAECGTPQEAGPRAREAVQRITAGPGGWARSPFLAQDCADTALHSPRGLKML